MNTYSAPQEVEVDFIPEAEAEQPAKRRFPIAWLGLWLLRWFPFAFVALFPPLFADTVSIPAINLYLSEKTVLYVALPLFLLYYLTEPVWYICKSNIGRFAAQLFPIALYFSLLWAQQNRMASVVFLACAVVLSPLLSAMLYPAKKQYNAELRKQNRQRQISTFCVAAAIFLLPGTVGGITQLRVNQDAVPVQQALLENAPKLNQLYGSTWNALSKYERRAVMQAIVDVECANFEMPQVSLNKFFAEPSVCTKYETVKQLAEAKAESETAFNADVLLAVAHQAEHYAQKRTSDAIDPLVVEATAEVYAAVRVNDYLDYLNNGIPIDLPN
jgi:hypothetical protein